MSEAEDRLVVETVVRVANGRVPVIAGTGSNSTDMAIKYTKMAQERAPTAPCRSPPTTTSRPRRRTVQPLRR